MVNASQQGPAPAPRVSTPNSMAGTLYRGVLHMFSPSLMQAVTLAMLMAAAYVLTMFHPAAIFFSILKIISVMWWMKVGSIVAYEGLANWQSDVKGLDPSARSARMSCYIGSICLGSLDIALGQNMGPTQFRQRIIINGAVCLLFYILLSAAGIAQRALSRSRLAKGCTDLKAQSSNSV
uniref:Uncharacterized protein n=1 Tax=Tetraselmis chuii TaxID=63592 RepID=A0A7S1T032_9CHLO|mmetsp:Transcript_38031/g.68208  ORF Transcript_38031/g.68208 Transcript_38031/m.68208 type:complete len:179 (+) Transcript_38031:28-564(+)|eukprot:CAMPEP_0177763360 /NCGR_PEP_ID=MMETSP0491_2-20121128/6828_1 /TAXON_ID=63592 /ORGANISM="Tetraselmis chuii, Strain PLY429" /LENGTH=178 /DNA_ID=CAMNT_0019279459 /DNA_START=27 /DNA_END=563 /DNA_ORIENTATION=+